MASHFKQPSQNVLRKELLCVLLVFWLPGRFPVRFWNPEVFILGLSVRP